MSFNPGLIAQAPLAVQIHLATVIPAFFIGSWLIFFSTKGARFHRGLGVAFLSLMAVTALTTLFIRVIDPGRLSWIHLFIPLTLFAIGRTIVSLRRGNVRGHRNSMLALYFGALLIAGGFTFVPGRLMHAIFFD
jgi:uncharacterized membrane protein